MLESDGFDWWLNLKCSLFFLHNTQSKFVDKFEIIVFFISLLIRIDFFVFKLSPFKCRFYSLIGSDLFDDSMIQINTLKFSFH